MSTIPDPPGAPQPVWRASTDELLIELPATFDTLTSREQMLAIGQLVYTATGNSAAYLVGFLRDGQPVAVPDGAGRLLSRPVGQTTSRSRLASLARQPRNTATHADGHR